MIRTAFALFLLFFMVFSCKTSVKPQPADCDPGFLPCEDDVTTCCEVVCPELYHNCGDMLINCCLDTTSHQFSFSVDTIGIYGSYLNDVAIVNENDIWVVGALTIDDSTLQYPGETNYNAAHWNGDEWEYLKIYDSHLELYSIYYFSENDIWVTTFGFPIHWDGNDWTLYHLQNMGLNVSAGFSLWGTSSSDMYFVGYQGSIVHYDGVDFVQMESGTDVDLKDIAGTPDGEHVFAVGYDSSNGHAIILERDISSWFTLYYNESVIPEDDNYGTVYKGMDVYADTSYFATARGLWKYNFVTGGSTLLEGSDFYDLLTFGAQGLKVQSLNDIVIETVWTRVIHYNGLTWIMDNTVFDQYGPAQIISKGMDRKENIIVMVGYVNGSMHAFVARGVHY